MMPRQLIPRRKPKCHSARTQHYSLFSTIVKQRRALSGNQLRSAHFRTMRVLAPAPRCSAVGFHVARPSLRASTCRSKSAIVAAAVADPASVDTDSASPGLDAQVPTTASRPEGARAEGARTSLRADKCPTDPCMLLRKNPGSAAARMPQCSGLCALNLHVHFDVTPTPCCAPVRAQTHRFFRSRPRCCLAQAGPAKYTSAEPPSCMLEVIYSYQRSVLGPLWVPFALFLHWLPSPLNASCH